jgi:acyl-CoA thioesterase-2
MTISLAGLLDLLDLERIEQGRYRGRSPKTSLQRVFGGQVAAQALVAAGRTVPPQRRPHSLHAYFLRAGDPEVPIVYLVDDIREGRSFSTRRVSAVQHGKSIFAMSVSFHLDEDGVDHRTAAPDVPTPESLPTLAERIAEEPDVWPQAFREWQSFDIRHIRQQEDLGSAGRTSHAQFWLRAAEPLPEDPLLHATILTYASDLTLLASALVPHGIPLSHGGFQLASLDHAMWFHRAQRADRWVLYDQNSPSASGGRGLTSGRIFDRDGALVASVMQEGLVRRLR